MQKTKNDLHLENNINSRCLYIRIYLQYIYLSLYQIHACIKNEQFYCHAAELYYISIYK